MKLPLGGEFHSSTLFYRAITHPIDSGGILIDSLDGNSTLKLPRIGLFICGSCASNTGSLTGMAALEVVRQLGAKTVGICSLPAILNRVPRQSALIGKLEKLVVIDGCHNECAKRLLAQFNIIPDSYVNLERDLQFHKQGPFASLDFTAAEVQQAADAIIAAIAALDESD